MIQVIALHSFLVLGIELVSTLLARSALLNDLEINSAS
jgi:hypothetical protein